MTLSNKAPSDAMTTLCYATRSLPHSQLRLAAARLPCRAARGGRPSGARPPHTDREWMTPFLHPSVIGQRDQVNMHRTEQIEQRDAQQRFHLAFQRLLITR